MVVTDSEPQPDFLRELEQAAADYANEAGTIATDSFRGVLVLRDKGGHKGQDLATDIDDKIQNFIQQRVARDYPNHAVLGEEERDIKGLRAADFVWAVDPIDGTKNFINGVPEFGISIAVLYRGVPVVGVIWTSWIGNKTRVARARRGGGSYINDKPLKIAPTEATEPQRGRLSLLPGNFAATFNITDSFKEKLYDLRVMGCAVWEVLMFAEGSAQYMVSAYCRVWDLAAGVLFVKEAGGCVVTAQRGERWADFETFHNGAEYSGDHPTYRRLWSWKQPVIICPPSLRKYLTTNISPSSRFGETQTDSIPARNH